MSRLRPTTVFLCTVLLFTGLVAALPACGADEPGTSDAGGRGGGDRLLSGPSLIGDGSDPDPDPPFARWEMVEGLREAVDAPRHASDGGGRVWVSSAHPLGAVSDGTDAAPESIGPVVAGTAGRWSFVFEAGEYGIAEEGVIQFKVSPFWRWSQPWCLPPEGIEAAPVDPMYLAMQPGFTEVSTDEQGLELEVIPVQMGVLIVVGGRPMLAGEQVRVVYGAGGAGARADDFAERGAPFWFAVDGDGDGYSQLLQEPARVDIVAGSPAQLLATLTSCLSPGETGRLTLAVLDRAGSAGAPFEGTLRLVDAPPSLGLPAEVLFTAHDEGRVTLDLQPQEEGVFRLVVEGPDGLLETTNPLVVLEGLEPVRWADLHGHSQVSDGTGTPTDYYTYARDVAALDIVALTDHDHWGERKLDADPETWEHIREIVRASHEPGRFVALLGYEWTSWIHGHRHVLSFDEQLSLDVLSSIDPDYETPRQLWDALAGEAVLTFAHHSAGGPIATNWTYRPDPVLEPVTEVVSVHGVSEALDAPHAIYSPRPGNFVRDVLDAGMRFGFIGSGDSHDGHPGLSQLSNPSGVGGLAAVLTPDLTREGVLSALRQRRVYATSGARIVLRCSLDGQRMGSTMSAADANGKLSVLVYGTAPIVAIDMVRSGEVMQTRVPDAEAAFDLSMSWNLVDLQPGEYVYVRVVQADGHMAWTSPFFLD